MPTDVPEPELIEDVPLFPLPNLVLFPRVVLPLHVFEQRYREMTADALAGDRQIAMALLKPGYQSHYEGCPPIEPVVCIGTITSQRQLDDGRYNLLLQGVRRARVLRENHQRSYRRALLRPLDEIPAMEIDLGPARQRIADILGRRPLADTPLGAELKKLAASPIPTAVVADVLAFHLLESVATRQALLAEADVRRRVERLAAALAEQLSELPPSGRRPAADDA
jgi:Lon protease-like protein